MPATSLQNSTTVRSTNSATRSRPKKGSRVLSAVRGGVSLLDSVSPSAAAWTAVHLFTFARRRARPTRERALLREGRRLSVPFEGEYLSACEWGSGPTVLLVHGWEGRGTQLGSFVEPLVRSGRRVVAFDAPAHGDSPGLETTLGGFAAAVEAVARAVGPLEGLEGIVAHSFGAAAVTIALARGLSAEKAVLLAPFVDVERAVSRFETMVGLSEEASGEFRETLTRRNGASVEELEGRTLARAMTTRLQVVHDDDDREVSPAQGTGLAEVWPGAELVRTKGLGHYRILRASEVVAGAVEFLTGAKPCSAQGELDYELFHRETRRRPLQA
jgi:pimeloyl-ACP methyl ester carboxylesterase